MRNLAIIPARSGSKGIKDKNIRKINGRPLLNYSVSAAIDSGVFSEVMVSTDSPEYAEIAESCGASVPFLRSRAAAGDKATNWDTIREVLARYRERGLEFDTFCWLQPTSPLRNAYDIIAAYDTLKKKNAKAVVSVCEMEHTPLWSGRVGDNGELNHFIDRKNNVPRQMLPPFFRLNGAIYISFVSFFYEDDFLYRDGCFAYVMPVEKSIDIDSENDLYMIEMIMNKQGSGKQGEC